MTNRNRDEHENTIGKVTLKEWGNLQFNTGNPGPGKGPARLFLGEYKVERPVFDVDMACKTETLLTDDNIFTERDVRVAVLYFCGVGPVDDPDLNYAEIAQILQKEGYGEKISRDRAAIWVREVEAKMHAVYGFLFSTNQNKYTNLQSKINRLTANLAA